MDKAKRDLNANGDDAILNLILIGVVIPWRQSGS